MKISAGSGISPCIFSLGKEWQMKRFNALKAGMMLVLLAATLAGQAWGVNKNPEIEAEIQAAIRQFSFNSASALRNAIEDLKWAGISDERIYDIAEKELLSNYMSTDKYDVENASWQVKGLAVSGNAKYLPTVQKVMNEAAHKKLRKHATTANSRLADYIVWNPIISAGTESAPKGQLHQTRIANMLQSDKLELNRGAAKLVYRDYGRNDKLLGLIQTRLLAIYKVDPRNKLEIDTTAWLARALAGSGKQEFISTLEKVANETTSPKVTKYIQKYMKTYH